MHAGKAGDGVGNRYRRTARNIYTLQGAYRVSIIVWNIFGAEPSDAGLNSARGTSLRPEFRH